MKAFSQLIRVITVLLFGLGALCPLVSKLGKDLSEISHWSYIFLLSAGILVLFDSHFGFSSSWMRFMKTSIKLQSELNKYYLAWNTCCVNSKGNTNEETMQKLSIMTDFTNRVDSIVLDETIDWIKEFEKNILRLEEILKTK
jgi:hypothetical protein